MIVGRIPGATRVLGAPKGWDETQQGHVTGLPVLDLATVHGPAMTSVWELTPKEIERIKAGACIYLTVLGTQHPPVFLAVGASPDLKPGEIRNMTMVTDEKGFPLVCYGCAHSKASEVFPSGPSGERPCMFSIRNRDQAAQLTEVQKRSPGFTSPRYDNSIPKGKLVADQYIATDRLVRDADGRIVT